MSLKKVVGGEDKRRQKNEKVLIICDLSDVLIKGLEGAEHILSKELGMPFGQVASLLFTYDYRPLWYGETSESSFFTKLLRDFGWDLPLDRLLASIHKNFYEIEGTLKIYEQLCKHHTLVLYSVNCPEWVERMKSIVDYSNLFHREFYSYDLKSHKKEPAGFKKIKQLYPDHQYYLIDDSRSNIRMAESLQITGLRFTSSTQLLEVIKERDLL